jgi:type VI secretion system protein ImpA
MASPPTLEFDALLAPIPGDAPAGSSLPFAVREKLDEFRKEINPDAFDADDPLRPENPKMADWSGIVRVAQETLTNTSKDLLAAARMLEALTKSKGFAGLRDGLQLLRRLMADCWDRIYPSIEDGDLEVRAGPFNWLDDPDRGARFPSTLRLAPVLQVDGQTYSWLNWREMLDGKKGAVKPEVFDGAIDKAPRPQCQDIVDDLAASQEELKQLATVLTEKLGEFAPAMGEVRRAIDDCQTLAQQILKKKGPPPVEAPPPDEAAAAAEEGEATEDGEAAAPAAGRRAGPRALTRDDVYKQLADVASLLQKLEPHSPIPYLIQRACALGAMPFPRLMKELVRDENILTEMNRELGIKEESAEG